MGLVEKLLDRKAAEDGVRRAIGCHVFISRSA
jgi:hypothetical protein